MGGLITILGTVPDPRTGNAQRHDLLEVLTIVLMASICGCQTCVDMADFAEDREALFRAFLRLENGLPSHDTFSRLFRLIDPETLSSAFGRFLTALGSAGVGKVDHGAQNLATVRKLALNVLKQARPYLSTPLRVRQHHASLLQSRETSPNAMCSGDDRP